jgi:hypothetical protein
MDKTNIVLHGSYLSFRPDCFSILFNVPMGAVNCGDEQEGAYLCIACKSDTVSLEVDLDHFFTPAWRTTCFGKFRCCPRRAKSFMDTGFLRASITPMSLARQGIIGAVAAHVQGVRSFALAPEAFPLRAALRGTTSLASFICKAASVIRLQIASCSHLVFQYQLAATLKSGFLTLLMANLVGTIRGFQRHIIGQKEINNASLRSQEPPPLLRVLVLGSPQAGAVVP